MRPETLAKVEEQLGAEKGSLAFLNKLSDEEGDILAKYIAELELHCAPEAYVESHWEDD